MAVSSFLPPVQIVKSVQQGQALSGDVIISAVNPAKTMVTFNGCLSANTAGIAYLKSATEVSCFAGAGNSVRWQAVEFY